MTPSEHGANLIVGARSGAHHLVRVRTSRTRESAGTRGPHGDPRRGALCLHAYIHGILGQWLLVPDSFSLYDDAERLVETVLDMLRFSPALRDPAPEAVARLA